MAKRDDKVRPGGAHLWDDLLRGINNIVCTDGAIAKWIPPIFDLGRAKSRDADPDRAPLPIITRDITFQNVKGPGQRFAVAAGNIRTYDRKLGFGQDIAKKPQPIVKFMVAQGHRVIFHQVECRDHRVRLIWTQMSGQVICERTALNGIAVVAKQGRDTFFIPKRFNLIDQANQTDAGVRHISKVIVVKQLHVQVCGFKDTQPAGRKTRRRRNRSLHDATLVRILEGDYAILSEKIALVQAPWHPGAMKIAETVTFGGSRFDRAAEMRGQAQAMRKQGNACAILLWRGKPMIAGDDLLRLPMDHPVMVNAAADMIFLGREDAAPVFAADLSAWQPEGPQAETLDRFLDPSEQRHSAVPGAAFAELRAIMARLSPRDAELAATAKAVMEWHRSHRFCARCGAQSQIAMGGWQRDCAVCDGHHFPRTDPVVIMLITHGNAVLVGRSPGWPEGMYSLLAGFVEPGETIEAAVRREVFEEAGVRVGAVSYLSSQPWPFPASLMLGCAGDALDRELTIDPEEIEDAMWVTREEMAEAFAGNHPGLLPARKGAIAHFLLQAWLSDRLG